MLVLLILQMGKLRNRAGKLTGHRLFSKKALELRVLALKQMLDLSLTVSPVSNLLGLGSVRMRPVQNRIMCIRVSECDDFCKQARRQMIFPFC